MVQEHFQAWSRRCDKRASLKFSMWNKSHNCPWSKRSNVKKFIDSALSSRRSWVADGVCVCVCVLPSSQYICMWTGQAYCRLHHQFLSCEHIVHWSLTVSIDRNTVCIKRRDHIMTCRLFDWIARNHAQQRDRENKTKQNSTATATENLMKISIKIGK